MTSQSFKCDKLLAVAVAMSLIIGFKACKGDRQAAAAADAGLNQSQIRGPLLNSAPPRVSQGRSFPSVKDIFHTQ